MRLVDTHTHTRFSTDSKESPENMLKAAKDAGLSTLCFTDHMDLDFPEGKNLFVFDPTEYFRELTPLKEAASTTDCKLLLGIEVGLRPNRPKMNEELHELLRTYPFDYVIGSVHIVDELDPYREEYWQKNKDGLLRYFIDTYEDIKRFDAFDSLGHLDYAVRYLPSFVSQTLDYAPLDYLDILTSILKHLIEHGKSLELNTGGLRRGLSFVHPKKEILSLYRELGGELVTLGSDAHRAQDVGADIRTAAQLLQSCGFRYYAVYQERTANMIPLV